MIVMPKLRPRRAIARPIRPEANEAERPPLTAAPAR
jgi:hypothetical protein